LTCLSADEVNAIAAGLLDAAASSRAHLHLDQCGSCRKLVAAVADSGAQETPRSGAVVRERMPIGRGTVIGRYVVDRVLGAGGMGVVYAAHDPELDRPVALKLLHEADAEGEPCEDRLRQEARAMARLDHANVLRVHDVGRHGDRTFIAMEFVEGRTLRRWLVEEPRSTAAIVEVLVRAGRGLCAAHEAGILHGDFKPDNVFISSQGCVVVGDFGLARPLEQPWQDDDIGGTPAYLAPEVLAGARPAAASDQFSFCVSFWEAVHGARPGRRFAHSPDVPRWLRRALMRGLHPDAAARHPSLAALLDDIERAPRRQKQIAAGAAFFIAAAGAATMFLH
jgi:serine/threonine protein kinase